jgi:hypothetical protein
MNDQSMNDQSMNDQSMNDRAGMSDRVGGEIG